MNPLSEPKHWIEPAHWRVRAMFGGETIVDSRRVMMLLSNVRTPVYYFPFADAKMELLSESVRTGSSDIGVARYWHLRVGDRVVEDVARSWVRPASGLEGIIDHVAFKWDAMDMWLEEDEEVFVHPKDPYKRIDVRESSRHVVATAAGVVIAETSRPRLLFETGLPMRYYFPMPDVRLDLLTRSDTVTHCPYKGSAVHYSAKIGEEVLQDIAWCYPVALPEAQKVQGLIAFYPKRLDSLTVDGVEASTANDPF